MGTLFQRLIAIIAGLFMAGRPNAAPDAQTQAGGLFNSTLFYSAIGGALLWVFSPAGRAWRMEFSALEIVAFLLVGAVVGEVLRNMKPPGAA